MKTAHGSYRSVSYEIVSRIGFKLILLIFSVKHFLTIVYFSRFLTCLWSFSETLESGKKGVGYGILSLLSLHKDPLSLIPGSFSLQIHPFLIFFNMPCFFFVLSAIYFKSFILNFRWILMNPSSETIKNY